MQTATAAQSQLDHPGADRSVFELIGLHRIHVDGDEQRILRWRQQPLLFEFATPGVYLLTCHIVPMSNFCDRGSGNTNRHDNRELLIVAPSTPPLSPKNFNAHRTLRLRHVANDVVKHVS